jgi:hypothetical protein
MTEQAGKRFLWRSLHRSRQRPFNCSNAAAAAAAAAIIINSTLHNSVVDNRSVNEIQPSGMH